MALAPTRLLVLGVIRLLQPIHGYDVRRELLSWRADDWANIAPGSVYGALRTLERDSWIEPVDTSREGARPARTTYQVTDEGEKEFHLLLNDTWAHARAEPHPLLPAVALLPFTDRDAVLRHLEARALDLEADLRRSRATIDHIQQGTGDPMTGEPYHVAEMVRLIAARTEAELTWTTQLITKLQSGDLDPWADSATRADDDRD